MCTGLSVGLLQNIQHYLFTSSTLWIYQGHQGGRFWLDILFYNVMGHHQLRCRKKDDTRKPVAPRAEAGSLTLQIYLCSGTVSSGLVLLRAMSITNDHRVDGKTKENDNFRIESRESVVYLSQWLLTRGGISQVSFTGATINWSLNHSAAKRAINCELLKGATGSIIHVDFCECSLFAFMRTFMCLDLVIEHWKVWPIGYDPFMDTCRGSLIVTGCMEKPTNMRSLFSDISWCSLKRTQGSWNPPSRCRFSTNLVGLMQNNSVPLYSGMKSAVSRDNLEDR